MAGIDDVYTKALLHMDGANTSTTFTDESGKAWTRGGSAQISTANYEFGGASGLFASATSDYISTPTNTDFNLGTGDFTIDYWMKSTQTTQYATHFAKCPGAWGTGMWTIICHYAGAGDINFYAYDYAVGDHGVLKTTTGLINTGNWTHIAVVRSGNNWNLYVGGVSKASLSASITIADLSGGVSIARDETNGRYYNGNIDEFRFSKGIARWTANFTPPAGPYGPPQGTPAATAPFFMI
jgi:hypothetical protein